MARPIKRIQAEAEVVEELRRRARARTSLVRERERAEIILLRLDGIGVAETAARLKTTAKRVSTWSKRFEMHGLAGLEEAAGRGRKPSIPTRKVARVVTEVTQPPKGRKRWSVRSMGRHAGVSHSTVQRIWSKNDLKPHVTRTFKLSTDTDFERKVLGRDRPISRPADECAGAVLRREKPMPSAGALTTQFAAQSRSSAHDHA
jgi:transposase